MILVVATSNRGKLREYRALLDGLPLQLRPSFELAGAPAIAETAATYVDNARAKARALAEFSGLAALADDSGLEVDALGGAPGVRSARFAADARPRVEPADDAANTALLLERLGDAPDDARRARFRCAIVVARPDGSELVAEGTCEGTITDAPRGAGGFGYDPVFFYPPLGRTFAELAAEEKDRVSHRAKAVAALRPQLVDFLRAPLPPP